MEGKRQNFTFHGAYVVQYVNVHVKRMMAMSRVIGPLQLCSQYVEAARRISFMVVL
jgi:hypothetical protein